MNTSQAGMRGRNMRSMKAMIGVMILITAALTGCLPVEDTVSTGQEAFSVQLDLTNFTPHMSQKIEARVVNIATEEEVDRVTATGGPNVTMFFADVLDEGGSYRIDFYADLDMNLEYTPPVGDPPESFPDHQWRITGESAYEGSMGLNDAADDVRITVPHNTDFTDIDWPDSEENSGVTSYRARLDLTSFGPHIGQRIEGRVLDMADGREVARTVVTGELEVSLDFGRVLAVGGSYQIDFYADLDGSGDYTAPVGDPAESFPDHQWRITGETDAEGASGLSEVAGDVVITFPHNANWVDVDWPGSEDNG